MTFGMVRKYDNPYLVIGTGRCGTSTVSRILHEELGIYMGGSFLPPDKDNPQGYYEDADFYWLNYNFYKRGMSLKEWLDSVLSLIKKRQELQRPWGIKSVRMVDILGLYLSLFDEPKIICCYRDLKGFSASLKRCYSCSNEQAENTYFFRITIMKRLLESRDYLPLDFTDHLEDEYIENCIKEKWELRKKQK